MTVAMHTPLLEAHQALGARCIEFAGWTMPLSYSGATEEHRAVRERCGLFDVSHMGEIELTGPDAMRACQEITVNDVARLEIGDAQYSILCNEAGGVLDDLIVLRLGRERYLLIVNASTTAADLEWIRARVRGAAEVTDRSRGLALLALQGPESEVALRPLTAIDLTRLRPFTAARGRVAGVDGHVSRTGYTGEDGFEVLVDATEVVSVWEATLAAVRQRGGLPAGLAARDTLRLEAGLPLNGTDMNQSTTPLEAGLGWVVKLEKGPFIGREALMAQRATGPRRRLVGIEMDEAGIPRHGCGVWRDETLIGTVTSGGRAPTLGRFIAMAYVATNVAAVGTAVAVDIRGRRHAGRIVSRPFYHRIQREEMQ